MRTVLDVMGRQVGDGDLVLTKNMHFALVYTDEKGHLGLVSEKGEVSRLTSSKKIYLLDQELPETTAKLATLTEKVLTGNTVRFVTASELICGGVYGEHRRANSNYVYLGWCYHLQVDVLDATGKPVRRGSNVRGHVFVKEAAYQGLLETGHCRYWDFDCTANCKRSLVKVGTAPTYASTKVIVDCNPKDLNYEAGVQVSMVMNLT